ncbi:TetR/AcrR family transcriptional regulator [Hymenobacter jejuensis]|uniref:TetR/AcrR family transcriptional regulator n=1 Tax=Hymenobacter jejuensis TaxID=2502781 RepID=A0A5B7ZZ90_9BACT|nr:TetR family transcriptional regulator [Hymenobacter jejuensis]QDA60157.1 TetR/AcrR family transcriptional regulator [Hymenobacter jejuensis]
MQPNLKSTLLDEVQQLFHRHGVRALSEDQIITSLSISPATFYEMFQDKNDLVDQAARHDLERQKREHAAMFAKAGSPVERILLLLQHGIKELRNIPGTLYSEIQQDHPQTWAMMLDHLATYSYPQIHNLLNDGILQKQFRSDINIELVTKIILEQVNLLLNADIFPPSRYNLSEVFRSIYLYYIRGICTDEGFKLVAAHFSKA